MPMRILLILQLVASCGAAVADTLSGTVTDDGEAVARAYVILYADQGDLVVNAVHTDEQGSYRFALSPGRYRLSVDADQYAHKQVNDIVLDGGDKVVDVALTPSAFVEKPEATSDDDCN